MLILLLSACRKKQNNVPEHIIKPKISDEIAVNVMADVHVAEGILNNQNKKPTKKYNKEFLYSFIYTKYNINAASLDSLIAYLTYHPDEYDALYIKVADHLKAIELIDSLPKNDTSVVKMDSIVLDSNLLTPSIDSSLLDSINIDSLSKPRKMDK